MLGSGVSGCWFCEFAFSGFAVWLAGFWDSGCYEFLGLVIAFLVRFGGLGVPDAALCG